MKINGALKPRQGASREGSSPGVVQQEYRIKRYFKQQQTTTTLTRQLEQKRKRGSKFSGTISSSLSKRKFYTSIGTKNLNYYSTSPSTLQSRVTDITKAKKTFSINLSSGRNKTEVAATDAAIDTKNIKKTSVEIHFHQRTVITNTTTRPIKDTKLHKANINCDEEQIKQIKVYKTTSNTSKDHATSNKSHNNKTSSTRTAVNKFLFVPKIINNLNLTVVVQLKLLIFSMLSHAIKYLNGKSLTAHSGDSSGCTASIRNSTTNDCHRGCGLPRYTLAIMMRASQLLSGSIEPICFTKARRLNTSITFYMAIFAATAILLLQPVVGDDGDTFFPINGLETTTPEFDYASRGQKKFGDKCENTLECGFPGSICDPKKKSCQCTEDLPVTNHIDKCGKEAAVNESCFFNEQCEVKYFQTECRDQRCVCRFDMTPIWLKDGSVECKGRGDKKGPETYIDPAMIGVLIGMALMFIIICVVLRLFSQARWRENRTIFNTPNPRLMNVSLLRESKLLHGQERRGSRMSVRAPSRQPSMASLRPHSPNPSLGKTGSRSNSHGSNASATSIRSARSNSVSPAGIAVGNNSHHERKGSTYQPHQHQQPQQQKLQTVQSPDQQTNVISNPVAETVSVEIIEPEK